MKRLFARRDDKGSGRGSGSEWVLVGVVEAGAGGEVAEGVKKRPEEPPSVTQLRARVREDGLAR